MLSWFSYKFVRGISEWLFPSRSHGHVFEPWPWLPRPYESRGHDRVGGCFCGDPKCNR
jgi:hypothetical protein